MSNFPSKFVDVRNIDVWLPDGYDRTQRYRVLYMYLRFIVEELKPAIDHKFATRPGPEPPERALADPIRFMAYAMTYARHEDMRLIRQYVSDEDFREVLDRAPPGIIDPRSWAYWNSKMGRFPPPPLPKRHFGDDKAPTALETHRMESTQKLAIAPEKKAASIDRRLSVAPMMDWTD